MLLLAVGLSACPDSVSERLAGRAESVRPEVTAQGLLEALTFYADTASLRETSGRSSPQWQSITEATFRAMRSSDAGDLSPEDDQLLRERVVPLVANLSLAHQKAEAFQPWCEPAAEEGDTFRHVLKSALAKGPRNLPARWEGDYDQGYESFFAGPNRALKETISSESCNTGTLAFGLVRQSALHALTNIMQLRVILREPEIRELTSSPADYASWVLNNYLPEGLSDFSASLEPDLQEFARGLAASLDEQRASDARYATWQALRDVAARAGAEIRRQKPFNPEWEWYASNFVRACEPIVRRVAGDNVILASKSTVDRLCDYRTRGDRSQPTWTPVYADLQPIVDDLGASVTAYLGKLSEAWSRDQGAQTIKRASRYNVAGIAAVIDAYPACMARMCSLLGQAQADRESERWWQGVIMWGTAIVGIAALVTGVGALAVGAAGLVGVAAGVATTAAVVTTIGSVATLAGALYLGSTGARRMADTHTDLAALLISGADRNQIQADYDRGVSLVVGALLDGALSIADLAAMVKALRAAGAARGLARLEEEVKAAERAAVAARRAEAAAAQAAAKGRASQELLEYAERFRPLPQGQRPGSVGRLTTLSDGARLGRSGFCSERHKVVQRALDELDELAKAGRAQKSDWHGKCAEIHALSQALEAAGRRLQRPVETIEQAREVLRGSRVETAYVRPPGSKNAAMHGALRAPCKSCAYVLERLGVSYH